MEITSRTDAYRASTTPKSQLKAFEKRIHDLRECSVLHLIASLYSEKCEFVFDPKMGIVIMGIKALATNNFSLADIKYFGDPLGSDFQFRKTARRGDKNKEILPQRFHGRVFIFEKEFVIVSETETDPLNIVSGIVHYIEPHEHRIIRLRRVQ